MIVRAQQLKEADQAIHPNLRNFWPFDPKYQYPTDEELKEAVEYAKQHEFLRDYVNRGPVEDCDNAALYSSAIIHHWWARLGKTTPVSYGRTMGYKFRGMRGGHCLNQCRTESGLYYIDFDAGGRIWKASKENDAIFFSEYS